MAAGIKVLVRALPEFSVQYGLTLHIDAIDSCYTLGDLEAEIDGDTSDVRLNDNHDGRW